MSTRILVFRALQLGDMLCAIPALRALRGAFPAAEIVHAGLPWSRELAARLPAYVDGFVTFPGYPGLPEQAPSPQAFPEFLSALRDREWDLAIQLHGSGEISNQVIAQARARQVAGFGLFGLRYLDEGHEIHRLRRVLDHLGVDWTGDRMEFPVAPFDRRGLARVRPHRDGVAQPYVCLHPGGRSGVRWAPEHFVRVGRALAGRGLPVMITGSADERPLGTALAARIGGTTVDLTGLTTLGTLAAALEGAEALVANDSGVAHLAAALGTPSVVLFDPRQIERWAPLDRVRHRVLAPISSVQPEAVLAAVEELTGARDRA